MRKSTKLLLAVLAGTFCFGATSCGLIQLPNSSSDSTPDESVSSSADIGDSSSSIVDSSSADSSSAVATYTVTFDTDGGSTIEAQTVESGNTLAAITAPTKQGYVFDGWTLNDNAFDTTTAITANITLKATWKAAIDTPYTVEVYVEQEDGSFAKYEAENWSENKKGTTGATVDATDNLQLQQWGCDLSKFKGMEYDYDAEGTVKTGTIAADGSLTIKLYVKYVRHTITYSATNGTLSKATETVKNGATLTAPTVTANTGYAFDNVWYNGEEEFDFETTVSSDLTLTAKCNAITYTITYTLTDPNGGYSGDSDGDNVKSYTIETETFALKPATSDNYVFAGWYNEDGVLVDSIEKGTTGNLTLTAKWTIKVAHTNIVEYTDVSIGGGNFEGGSAPVATVADGKNVLVYQNGTWSAWTFVDVAFPSNVVVKAGDVLSFDYKVVNTGCGAATHNLRTMVKGTETLIEDCVIDNIGDGTWRTASFVATQAMIEAGGIRHYVEISHAACNPCAGVANYDAYFTEIRVTNKVGKTKVSEIVSSLFNITATTAKVTKADGSVVTEELNATLDKDMVYTIEGTYLDGEITRGYKATISIYDAYTVDFETISVTDLTKVTGWNEWDTMTIENGALRYCKAGEWSIVSCKMPQEWLDLIDVEKHIITVDIKAPAGTKFNIRITTPTSLTQEGGEWIVAINDVVGTGEYVTYKMNYNQLNYLKEYGVMEFNLETSGVEGNGFTFGQTVCYFDNIRLVEKDA